MYVETPKSPVRQASLPGQKGNPAVLIFLRKIEVGRVVSLASSEVEWGEEMGVIELFSQEEREGEELDMVEREEGRPGRPENVLSFVRCRYFPLSFSLFFPCLNPFGGLRRRGRGSPTMHYGLKDW